MNPCPYDHAEMQSYGHNKCPYCRMPLAAMDGPLHSDAPETEALRQNLWGKGWADSYVAMMGHAKRLEHERNQWREKAEAREILRNSPPEKPKTKQTKPTP
jgi:hypothetical protein